MFVLADGMRVLGADAGLPDLPFNKMGLLVGPTKSPEATALAEEIRATLRGGPRPIRIERPSDLVFAEGGASPRPRSRAMA